ncbi:MAG: ATP-binding protein [Roseovarius sp.]|nr:ATP-binding protein [Roseovarius sp.]
MMADIAELSAFSEIQDRDSAMFFTGRDVYITHIRKACEGAAKNIAEGGKITSATRLFYGAPGAGKTSLLTEIQVRARLGAFGTPVPTVIDIDCEHLKQERDLVLILAKHLKKEGVFRTVSHEQASIGAHILNILQGSLQKGQSQDPPEATFDQLESLYTAAGTPSPILLCVDEIQTIQPEAKAMLSRLHQGKHGLPIIPIYAGLGNSLQILMSHNISRPVSGYIHSVGALADTEAQAAVTAMLDRFEVDQRGADRDWPATLAQQSDGWPQHLHNAMRALALELIRPEVNGVLAHVNPEAVFTQERRLRMRAYGWRISEMLHQTKGLAAQVMHHIIKKPRDRSDVESLVLILDQNAPTDPARRPYSLPEGKGAEDYVDHMMRQGVLQEFHEEQADGTITDVLRCPIPSLATFVMERGGVDPSHRPPDRAAESPKIDDRAIKPKEEEGDDGTTLGL